MQIGKTIREYRKKNNMTQEEMARRLGVTAPAVNKWENGNSMPDITLLAPIARLLNISLDTLLSFREELTKEEIVHFLNEAENQFKGKGYDDAFQWAKKTIEAYPNCTELILQLAAILDAYRLTYDVPSSEKYDMYICDCYTRALASEDENIRHRAADALFGFYSRKEQYDKAEECLSYFSIQNPERKRKQAQLYQKTGQTKEAYKALEELLFADYQMVSMTLHNLFLLAMQEENLEKAHSITKMQTQLAAIFEMGKYYEISWQLDLATYEKDADAVINIMQEMLANIAHISDFQNSPLYEHMEFSKTQEGFLDELKKNLLASFCDETTYAFLKDDMRWRELTNRETQ